MVELKDFITTGTMQEKIDNYILNETAGKIYKLKIAVDVNEERCKEWIKQSMEIETFTKEQIEDLKVKNLFEKLEKENEKLKQELEIKDLAFEIACEYLEAILDECQVFMPKYHKEGILEQAKESIDAKN